MKILYCDPVIHTDTSREYKYYDEVFDCIIEDSTIEVFLHRGVILDATQINENFDLVVFGLGWFNHKFFAKIPNLETPSICILFKPQNNLSEKLQFCKLNNVSRILTPIPEFKKYEKETGIRTDLFPYGHCDKTFMLRPEVEKKIDIGFSGALHENKHYPDGAFPVKNIRTKIGQQLSEMKHISTFWKSTDYTKSRIPSYEEYAKKINTAKIWIATQAAFGDITPRYYEVLSSGTLLMCQKIPEQYKHILVHGKNCIEFENDLSDFKEKVDLYVSNTKLREEIVSSALKMSESHTWKQRADQLIKIAREVTS